MARSGRFADASANGIDVAFAGRRSRGVRRTSTRGLSLNPGVRTANVELSSA